MADDFSRRLASRILGGFRPIVVGLDPRIEALPAHLLPEAPAPERISAFYAEVLPRLAPFVPVVKPNLAFFERHAAAGFGCYESTCRLATELGMLVIADIKRGDIESTARAHAEAYYALADAVTVHPYLGRDSVEPFLSHCRRQGKGLFVLVSTSNPSAGEFQDLETAQGRLFEVVARAVHSWGEGTGDPAAYALVGAVVGATRPERIGTLRRLMPRAWFLLPGVGAQGADCADVAAAFDERGLGGLVSQSRGVMQSFAPDDPDWLDRIEQAAIAFASGIAEVAR